LRRRAAGSFYVTINRTSISRPFQIKVLRYKQRKTEGRDRDVLQFHQSQLNLIADSILLARCIPFTSRV